MPFLNDEQRKLVVATLDEVLTDAELKEAFTKAAKRGDEDPSDYGSAMQGQFAGILQDVMNKRVEDKKLDEKIANDPDIVRTPGLEALRKKYGKGPELK